MAFRLFFYSKRWGKLKGAATPFHLLILLLSDMLHFQLVRLPDPARNCKCMSVYTGLTTFQKHVLFRVRCQRINSQQLCYMHCVLVDLFRPLQKNKSSYFLYFSVLYYNWTHVSQRLGSPSIHSGWLLKHKHRATWPGHILLLFLPSPTLVRETLLLM